MGVLQCDDRLPMADRKGGGGWQATSTLHQVPEKTALSWEFEFPFTGSLTFTFPPHSLHQGGCGCRANCGAILVPRKALRVGIQKSILSTFGNKGPQNGSTNGAERGWDNPTKGLLWTPGSGQDSVAAARLDRVAQPRGNARRSAPETIPRTGGHPLETARHPILKGTSKRFAVPLEPF